MVKSISIDRFTYFLSAPKKGIKKLKLCQEVEVVINDIIEEQYLKAKRPPITKFHKIIEENCRNAGLKTPHYNTVRPMSLS